MSDVDYRLYNFNYAQTTLGVQSLREIMSGCMWTEKVEYHWIKKLKKWPMSTRAVEP
jgi:hypothetical protein